MKTNIQTRRGFTLVELLVVIVIIASLASLSVPMIIRQKKKADQATAISNAGQLYYAFIGFDEEYGTFPDGTTATDVAADFPGTTIGAANTTNSNGYFRQLFIAGQLDSEAIFYVKTGKTKKPDGVTNGTECLAARENGFSYILDGTDALSTAGNSARPMICTPNDTATTFNADPFDKKAVFLRVDKSVTVENIKADNTVALMTDTTADSIWSGLTPTIVLPDGATSSP